MRTRSRLRALTLTCKALLPEGAWTHSPIEIVAGCPWRKTSLGNWTTRAGFPGRSSTSLDSKMYSRWGASRHSPTAAGGSGCGAVQGSACWGTAASGTLTIRGRGSGMVPTGTITNSASSETDQGQSGDFCGGDCGHGGVSWGRKAFPTINCPCPSWHEAGLSWARPTPPATINNTVQSAGRHCVRVIRLASLSSGVPIRGGTIASRRGAVSSKPPALTCAWLRA
jgi:hypothetical protein